MKAAQVAQVVDDAQRSEELLATLIRGGEQYCCLSQLDRFGWCRTHQRMLKRCDLVFGGAPKKIAQGSYNGLMWQTLFRGVPFPVLKSTGVPYTGERVIPEETNLIAHLNYLSHCMEYEAAATAVTSKMLVLDCACGVGYGSAILEKNAGAVIGVDNDEEAIVHADATYRSKTLAFRTADARRLPFDDDAFDAVVSIETVEHFAEADQFVAEIHRVLRPEGLMFMTTPNGEKTPFKGALTNQWHFTHYEKPELERIIGEKFRIFLIEDNGMGGYCYRILARKERRS